MYWADSSGRRNTSLMEVAMTTGKRRSDQAGRAKLTSLGRPPVARREHVRHFRALIAGGLSSEAAAVHAGMSPPVGARWLRSSGGMPPSHFAELAPPGSCRYLSFAEREEIAVLRAQGIGIRDIAHQLHRAPSTISRELRRNAATGSGNFEYRATTAQWHAERAARRPKASKLALNDVLRPDAQARCSGPMFRNGFPGRVWLWLAQLFLRRRSPGRDAISADESHEGGQRRGVRNR